jgi:hypothetical protein
MKMDALPSNGSFSIKLSSWTIALVAVVVNVAVFVGGYIVGFVSFRERLDEAVHANIENITLLRNEIAENNSHIVLLATQVTNNNLVSVTLITQLQEDSKHLEQAIGEIKLAIIPKK